MRIMVDRAILKATFKHTSNGNVVSDFIKTYSQLTEARGIGVTGDYNMELGDVQGWA